MTNANLKKIINTLSRRLIVFSCFFILNLICCRAVIYASDSTSSVSFRYPLNLPMSLSGNYGELRSNHFHSGIDFRVGGVEGAPIYATDDGYISKISISPSGYGNALYITHPNGYMSVYGHMKKYAPAIWKYAITKQMENQEFRLSVDLSSEVFPIKKGDLIGYAGNTGSSGGPHLHFEIRTSDSNLPLNVFAKKFISITDKVAPEIRKVLFVGMNEYNGVLIPDKTYSNAQNGVILLPEKSFVAIDAIDRMEGTYAKLAVETYNVYLDDTLIFSLNIGEVPFEKGRYINSLIYYPLKEKKGMSYIKSYVEEGNLLRDRINSVDNGLISLSDDDIHKVKVEVFDYKRNKTTKTYNVKRNKSLNSTNIPEGICMDWGMPNIYTSDSIEVMIPPASLYSSAYINFTEYSNYVSPYSKTWSIGDPSIPLHSGAFIKMKCSIPDTLVTKAFVAKVKSSGKIYYEGGVCSDTIVKCKISSFGVYTVAVDTIPPTITTTLKQNSVVKSSSIRFVIRDKISGISSYNVYIDDNWVLARYDAKSSRISISLQENGIKRGKHNIKVVVKDRCENETTRSLNFAY